MLTVRQVNPIFVPLIWPDIKDMIDKAMRHSAGEYNSDQLKVMVVNGSQTLLVAEEEGKIYGAATIVFETYPNDRIAFITCIGGKMLANKNIWSQFEIWCKGNSCTKVRGYAFEAVARLWKKRFGLESTYIIVEKKI